MNFNSLLNLMGFTGKAHGSPPTSERRRLSPRLLLAAALVALAVFFVHDARPAAAEHDGTTIWTSTLTWPAAGNSCGSAPLTACSSLLSDDDITFRGTDYQITAMQTHSIAGTRVTFNKALPAEFKSFLTLHVGSTALRLSDATLASGNTQAIWLSSGALWSHGATVQLKMNQRPSSEVDIWTSTLTWPAAGNSCGSAPLTACSSLLSDDDITFRGTDYQITAMQTHSIAGTRVTFNKALPAEFKSFLTLHVGSTALRLSDATLASGNKQAIWLSSGALWSHGATVQLKMTWLAHADAHLSDLTAESSTDGSTFTSLNIGAFDAHKRLYSATVPYTTTHVKLTPTVNHSDAKVAVKGIAVDSGSASAAIALSVGNNRIIVRVTAQNGSTRDYTVSIRRSAPDTTLSGLTAKKSTDGSTFTSQNIGAFNPDATSHPVTVPFTVTHVKLTPTVRETTSTVTVKGVAVTSGSESAALPLSVGDNPVTIRVTGGDGTTTRDYTIAIKRSAPDISLSVSASKDNGSTFATASLMPAVTPDTTEYVVAVPGVTHVKVTPTVNDSSGATFTVNTATVASGSASANIAVSQGSPTTVTVVVTATAFTRTYTIRVVPGHVAQIAVGPNPVDEGESAEITVTLTGGQLAAVNIPITVTAGSAESGDYSAPSSVRIAAGATTGTTTLRTFQDADGEDETLTVALGSNLPSNLLAGLPSSVTVTIDDDEVVSEVSLKEPGTVREGDTVTIALAIDPPRQNSVTIPLALANVDSESNDYSSLSSITIAAGDLVGTGEIRTNHDSDAEDEAFTVELGASLPLLIRAGTPDAVSVNIDDDEFISEVSVARIQPNPVVEGESAYVVLKVDPAQPNRMTIPVVLTHGDTEPGDFSSLTSVTVDANNGEGVAQIRANHDSDSDNEHFTVSLGSSLPALTRASPTLFSRIINIEDDEGTVQPRQRPTPYLQPGNGSLKVAWFIAADHSPYTSFDVQYRQKGTTSWTGVSAALSGGEGTYRYTISGLTNGTTYQVRVRARNSAGAGPWSWDSSLNEGRATPLTPVEGTPVAPPSVPTNITVAANADYGFMSLDVSWSAVTGATAYHLQYRKQGTSSWQKSGALSGDRWSNIYTTSETIQSLDSGTTYEVQVRALIENSIGSWSASATGTTTGAVPPPPPASAPAQVTGVSVTPDADYGFTILNVSWNALSTATEYHLQYRKSGATGWTSLGYEIYSPGTSTSIPNLGSGTTYQVQVRGVNSAGNGAWSASATGATTGTAPPSPITGPAPVQVTGVSVTPDADYGFTILNVSWNALSTANEYNIRYRQSGATGWHSLGYAIYSPHTSTFISSLGSGTTYEVQVNASNAGGTGPWSSIATGTTTGVAPPPPPASVPGQVSGVSVTPDADYGFITLNIGWNAVSTATEYNIRYQNAGATGWHSLGYAIYSPDTSTFISSLGSGTTYNVQVRAVNAAGAGQWSASAQGTTAGTAPPPPPASVPGQVTGVSVTPHADWGFMALDVSWGAVSTASEYNIQYRQSGTTGWQQLGYAIYSPDTSAAIYSLGNGTTYEVQVRAVNSVGAGAWSTSATGTTQ